MLLCFQGTRQSARILMLWRNICMLSLLSSLHTTQWPIMRNFGQKYEASLSNKQVTFDSILSNYSSLLSFSIKNYICLRIISYFIFIEVFHSFRTIFGNFGHCDAFRKQPLLTTSQLSLGYNCTFMHVRDMTS